MNLQCQRKVRLEIHARINQKHLSYFGRLDNSPFAFSVRILRKDRISYADLAIVMTSNIGNQLAGASVT
jgi:hypothetical protein